MTKAIVWEFEFTRSVGEASDQFCEELFAALHFLHRSETIDKGREVLRDHQVQILVRKWAVSRCKIGCQLPEITLLPRRASRDLIR